MNELENSVYLISRVQEALGFIFFYSFYKEVDRRRCSKNVL